MFDSAESKTGNYSSPRGLNPGVCQSLMEISHEGCLSGDSSNFAHSWNMQEMVEVANHPAVRYDPHLSFKDQLRAAFVTSTGESYFFFQRYVIHLLFFLCSSTLLSKENIASRGRQSWLRHNIVAEMILCPRNQALKIIAYKEIKKSHLCVYNTQSLLLLLGFLKTCNGLTRKASYLFLRFEYSKYIKH